MDGSVERLLAVDPVVLSLDDQLTHLAAVDAALAGFAAARERALAAINDPGEEKNWLREEVGCLLRWSFPYTAARLSQATHVVTALPRLLDLHAQGLIGDMRVRAAADVTCGLDAAVIAKVEERAPLQTPALFRAALRRAVAAEDPRTAEQRHEVATKDRTVRLCPLPDGMAGLWSVHTAVDAEAIYARLRELTATAAAGDGRGLEERRADLVRDLILGHDVAGPAAGGSTGARVHAQLIVPAAVADGTSDGPGELVGYGPIPASMCRHVMNQSGTTVERIHLDADGHVIPPDDLDDDRDTYRPSARMQRYLHAQWVTCRFPGCNRRAMRCESDHIEPWNGHNTIAANLQPLCLRHHHLKHEAGLAGVA